MLERIGKLHSQSKDQRRRTTRAKSAPKRILACVDANPMSTKVVPHAVAVAGALGARLTIVQVVEAPAGDQWPTDPVAWDLRRREAQAHLDQLAAEHSEYLGPIDTQLLEGHAAEQIAGYVRERGASLTCVFADSPESGGEWALGATARGVINAATSSILLVPASAAASEPVKYARLLAPLDGSSRAESALPVAVSIARAHGAELVLAHAIHEAQLIETGPLETEDVELCERLRRRNERVAGDYLDRVRSGYLDEKIQVRTLILTGSDVRRTLAQAVADEKADLVVLASHGRSGYPDVPSGDVAAYLMSHTETPLLIVRSQETRQRRRDYDELEPSGVRLPSRAEQ